MTMLQDHFILIQDTLEETDFKFEQIYRDKI